MNRIIEVEELVKIHHQVYVEYDNEGQLDNALNDKTVGVYDLDDFVENLQDYGIKVTKINENYSEELESIEYFDDYVED